MPGLLTRWGPYGELVDLRSRLDRLFEEPRPQMEVDAVDRR
jgi:hypothetical protein